jgi:hypothetical protein
LLPPARRASGHSILLLPLCIKHFKDSTVGAEILLSLTAIMSSWFGSSYLRDLPFLHRSTSTSTYDARVLKPLSGGGGLGTWDEKKWASGESPPHHHLTDDEASVLITPDGMVKVRGRTMTATRE